MATPILNHIVTRPLTHNGRQYNPGEFIELSPEHSAPLVAVGTVSVLPSEGERGSMVSTDDGHTFHCQGPMTTTDGGKTFACEGCGTPSIATGPASDVTVKHIGTPVVDKTPEVAPFFGTPSFGGKLMVTTDGGKTFHCAGPVVTVNNGSTFACESCATNLSEGSDEYVVGVHHNTPIVDKTPEAVKNLTPLKAAGALTPKPAAGDPVPVALVEIEVSSPQSAIVGKPFFVKVDALDDDEDSAEGFAGLVTFASTDGAAVLPASSPLKKGTGKFSVTLNTAGTQTVSATSGVVTGTSKPISVSA